VDGILVSQNRDKWRAVKELPSFQKSGIFGVAQGRGSSKEGLCYTE
jgi:hypothetical protein